MATRRAGSVTFSEPMSTGSISRKRRHGNKRPTTSNGNLTDRKNRIKERMKGVEPSTATLATWCSTTELHPQTKKRFPEPLPRPKIIARPRFHATQKGKKNLRGFPSLILALCGFMKQNPCISGLVFANCHFPRKVATVCLVSRLF